MYATYLVSVQQDRLTHAPLHLVHCGELIVVSLSEKSLDRLRQGKKLMIPVHPYRQIVLEHLHKCVHQDTCPSISSQTLKTEKEGFLFTRGKLHRIPPCHIHEASRESFLLLQERHPGYPLSSITRIQSRGWSWSDLRNVLVVQIIENFRHELQRLKEEV